MPNQPGPSSPNGPGSSTSPPPNAGGTTPGARPEADAPNGSSPRPDGEAPESASPRPEGEAPEGASPRPEGEAPEGSSPTSDGEAPEGAPARPDSDGEAPTNQWDPEDSPRNTVPQSDPEAPGRYNDQDVEDAMDRAPRNSDGEPVDHRTGEPLRPDTDSGRSTHMKWDPENGEWVLENPGGPRTDPTPADADVPRTDEPLPPPNDRWGDPDGDPNHPRADSVPDDAGNVGTVDPDVESPSGLTDSGRLQDPDVVPPELQPFVDDGSIINDDGVLRFNEQVDIEFNHSNTNHSGAEFDRQVELQQQSLSQQSAQDWEDNTTGYNDRRDETGSGRTGEAEQARYRDQQIQQRAETLQDQGLSEADARAQAQHEMSDQAVLHGPDQVAGGNPDQYTGMGDSGVNSSLGSQWGGQSGLADDLRAQMDAIIERSGIPDELLGDVRMNPNFSVNHTVDVP